MNIGKLSAGILNMKIDTFDSRTTPSEGTIPGLAVGAGNPLGLPSSGKSKNSKKKVGNKYSITSKYELLNNIAIRYFLFYQKQFSTHFRTKIKVLIKALWL